MPASLTDLLGCLDGSVTVVTANRRLARYLQQQYDLWQQHRLIQAWTTPDIVPINSWLLRCWTHSRDAKVLLNEWQSLSVWEQIVTATDRGWLVHPRELAASVQAAWQLLRQSRIELSALAAFTDFPDTQAFLGWAEEFTAICRDNAWIDMTDLPEIITAAILRQEISLPSRLIWLGFENLTPQMQHLTNILAATTQIEFFHLTERKARVNQLAIADVKQELQCMAQWSKKILTDHPSANIGCVVPDLMHCRDELQTVFSDVFQPWVTQQSVASLSHLFNIAGGDSLSSFPLVNDTLWWLQLSPGINEVTLISKLLLSPFVIAGEQEMLAKALIDAKLHEPKEPLVSLREIITLSHSNAPQFTKALRKWLSYTETLPTQQSPSQWAQCFRQQLQLLGWPGERSLNSMEYQVLQRWHTLLDEFASLELACPQLTQAQALQQLQQMARNTLFQIKTPNAPIQILGALEANGMVFDYLWVMGLTDQAWPPVLKPNPWLPYAFQRQQRLPNSHWAEHLRYYRQLTHRYTESANVVIMSYPLQEKDEPCRPSVLLAGFPAIALQEILPLTPITPAKAVIFEQLTDDQPPPVTSTEAISGGVLIIKYQAACPFQAFAKFRLKATKIANIEYGLSAIERGSVIHDALSRIWHAIGSQENLNNYAAAELDELMHQAIKQALIATLPKRTLTLKKQFTEIEVLRLKNILSNWLKEEKKRKKFNVVNKEYELNYNLSGLPIRMRVDRMDQLEDGSYIIIDYKTSETNTNAWFGPRPDEPQLPLYCLATEAPIAGLAFAEICPSKLRFNGIAVTEFASIKKNVSSEQWQVWQTEWKFTLTELATQFMTGIAAVTPKAKPETCRYCDFKVLCRVHEHD